MKACHDFNNDFTLFTAFPVLFNREELTVEDGLIFKGTRIVIPTKQWEAILKLIHEGHLGLYKCKLQAKETVYWPGLND